MKPFLARLVRACAFVIVATALWYGQSRVLAGWRAVSSQQLGSAHGTRTSGASLVVGAYNIAHGRGGRFGASNWTGQSRREQQDHLRGIAAQIAAVSPDLMVLNEADFASTWSRNVDQPLVVARLARFPYLATQRNIDVSFPFVGFRFGNAILSRFPLSDCRRIVFPAYSRRERVLAGNHDGLLCGVRTPLGSLRLLAVHLEYRSEAIRARCARVIDALAAAEPSPLVIAGDFNSAPRGLPNHDESGGINAMDYLLAPGRFQALLPPSTAEEFMTFPSEKPDRAIDWILTTPDLKQSTRRVHPSQLSDHRMVSVAMVAAPVAVPAPPR